MHWGEEFLSGRARDGERLAGVNALTTPALCPDSKQPELKHAAVKILKAELPWSLLAVAWLPDDAALAVRDALRALMPSFAFASCVPFGAAGRWRRGERTGVLLRAAGARARADDALLAQSKPCSACDGADTLRYADARRGQRRARAAGRADGDGDAGLEAFLLGGDTRAEAWIRPLLQDELPAQAYGRLLLRAGRRGAGGRGGARPPGLQLLRRDASRRSQARWRACDGSDGRAPGRAAGRAASAAPTAARACPS